MKRELKIIGTSGSPLRELTADEEAAVARLCTLSEEAVMAEPGGCDGIHDEGAPLLYLCTRCFPDGRRFDEVKAP